MLSVYIEHDDVHVYTNAGRLVRPLMVINRGEKLLDLVDAAECARSVVAEAD